MPEPPDVVAIDPSARNGTGAHPGPASGNDGRSPTRRRILIAGSILFVAAWTVAITYSVTAGGRSPERLDDANARVVEQSCLTAEHALAALPQVGERAADTARATRIASEDAILTPMVGRLRALHPAQRAPAIALTGWLDDWQHLITARRHYVHDLRTVGANARFVEPATAGVDPIADKMNNWILEQGTRTNACNTGQLQAEVVLGPRTYGPESNS